MRARSWMFGAATFLTTSVASPQGAMSVGGIVTDSSGAGLFGAVVSIENTGLSARTNERGEFRIAGVPSGEAVLSVRRIGFIPLSKPIATGESSDRILVTLAALPALLDKVVIQRSRIKYTGRLAGYYQRLERRSSGQFITRLEIDRQNARSLSQLLTQSPGISAVRLRSGGGAVRMRGRSCRPLVWLDGIPMPAGEVDLDAFPLNTLHGVELYLGSTTAPLDYTAQQNRSSCGSILLWSRGRDTDPPRRREREPVDIEELVASLSVFTSDQVDSRAELLSRQALESAYPPDLFAARTSGRVVAEFVVDASGRVEPRTFTVISSTHELLSVSVARAIEQSTFEPAVKDGKPVRQFVRQQFDFGPDTVELRKRD
ncbi:MAG: TonB family protein [Gemmatimonadaceae bacterium]